MIRLQKTQEINDRINEYLEYIPLETESRDIANKIIWEYLSMFIGSRSTYASHCSQTKISERIGIDRKDVGLIYREFIKNKLMSKNEDKPYEFTLLISGKKILGYDDINQSDLF